MSDLEQRLRETGKHPALIEIDGGGNIFSEAADALATVLKENSKLLGIVRAMDEMDSWIGNECGAAEYRSDTDE